MEKAVSYHRSSITNAGSCENRQETEHKYWLKMYAFQARVYLNGRHRPCHMLVRWVTIDNQFVTASEWGVEWVARRQNDEAGDVDDAAFLGILISYE